MLTVRLECKSFICMLMVSLNHSGLNFCILFSIEKPHKAKYTCLYTDLLHTYNNKIGKDKKKHNNVKDERAAVSSFSRLK